MVKIVTHGPYRIRQTSAAAAKSLSGTKASTVSQAVACPARKKPAQTIPSRKKPAHAVRTPD
jgi:hypothetical protein